MSTLEFIKKALETDDKYPGMWQRQHNKSFDATEVLCAASNLDLVKISPTREHFRVLRENAERYVREFKT